MVTIGVGLNLAPGSRHWLNEVESRDVGVFLAGDEHQALWMPGSLYACATLDAEQLEERAANMGLVLDTRQLGGTGVSKCRMDARQTAALAQRFRPIHASPDLMFQDANAAGESLLEALIAHLGREPRMAMGPLLSRGHGRIVRKAREYILANIEFPLTIGEIARAAATSHRTLYRAFADVLDETPQSFVRKLRLNRIRRDLASAAEIQFTVASIANNWGMSELGRVSASYRHLFGELPSETRARRGMLQDKPTTLESLSAT